MAGGDAVGKRMYGCSRRDDDGVVVLDQLGSLHTDAVLLLGTVMLFLIDRPVVGKRIDGYGLAVAAIELTFLFQFGEILAYRDRRDTELVGQIRHEHHVLFIKLVHDGFVPLFFGHIACHHNVTFDDCITNIRLFPITRFAVKRFNYKLTQNDMEATT